jgi:hypothetical protein
MSAKSYTYLGLCPSTRRRYIGVRTANQVPAREDIGVRYFSSSEHLPDNMLWRVLKEHDTPEEARAHEIELHKKYDVARSDKYFNRCAAGPTFYNSGHSEETRRKISKAQKGRKHTGEALQNIRKANAAKRGVPRSPETRRKIGEAHTGTKHRQATRVGFIDTHTGQLYTFDLIKHAKDFFGVTHTAIYCSIKRGTLLQKRWKSMRI